MASPDYSNRKDATDVGTLILGTTDIKALFRDASETRSAAEIDVGAVNDPYRWVKAGRLTGTLEVEVACEGSDLMTSYIGSVIVYSHDLNGTAKTGSALLSSKSLRSGGMDGAQSATFSLTIIS